MAVVLSLGLVLAPVAAPDVLMVPPPGQSAERLFPAEGVGDVRVSPSGRWISATARQGRVYGLMVQASGGQRAEIVLATESRPRRSWWVGDDTLIVRFATSTGSRYLIARMIEDDSSIRISRSWVDAIGWLVHPLPLVEDEVIWAFDYKGHTSLHRVTLDELRTFRENRTARGRFVLPGKELASISGHGRSWVVDREGNPRAVIRREDESYEVLISASDRVRFRVAREVGYLEEERMLEPVGVVEDQLVVLAYHDRDTVGLYEFDPRTLKIGRRIFDRPDVDVSDVLYDDLVGEVIAAVYEVDGETRYAYLESYGKRMLGDVADRFPAQSVEAVSGSVDGRYFVFRIFSATNPGVYYFQDTKAGSTIPIATQSSAIDPMTLSGVESFVVSSADGLEIEAFLTVPRGTADHPAPLVVMPHGGPTHVRDNRQYDPFVQYLASWGFAVLQPNYRGSSGYGRSFREAGKKQWAERIEDDIDAAVEWAMARPDIDARRLCIIGTNYGGFSALTSIVRHKHRYRCAISWNGVSDIPLLYDSSDTADSKRAMEFYEEYVGDPETEREKLLAVSPAYQAERIETPVLVIFGSENRRVDPDHSHRILLLLETLGKDHESLEIKGMGNGYTRAEGIIVARAMRRYLSQYLFPDVPLEPDPEVPTASGAAFLPEVRLEP